MKKIVKKEVIHTKYLDLRKKKKKDNNMNF